MLFFHSPRFDSPPCISFHLCFSSVCVPPQTIVLLRARLDDVEKERGVLLSRVSALEAEYAASQQQVREREHEITLRQRELARVRASINNKDNFKVVLDNRIKELEEREGG